MIPGIRHRALEVYYYYYYYYCLLWLTIEIRSRLNLIAGSDHGRHITWRGTGVDAEHHETDLMCYTSIDGKPVEWTEGWSYVVSRLQSFGKSGNTVEDGSVWMMSRVWKIDQNRVEVFKPRDD